MESESVDRQGGTLALLLHLERFNASKETNLRGEQWLLSPLEVNCSATWVKRCGQRNEVPVGGLLEIGLIQNRTIEANSEDESKDSVTHGRNSDPQTSMSERRGAIRCICCLKRH